MKKLKHVGFFRELPHGDSNGESLLDNVNRLDAKLQDKILDYLNKGELFLGSPGLVNDVLSKDGAVIGSLGIYTDGEWAWPSDLAFYVSKYKVDLPEVFLDHIKNNKWVIGGVDLNNLEL